MLRRQLIVNVNKVCPLTKGLCNLFPLNLSKKKKDRSNCNNLQDPKTSQSVSIHSHTILLFKDSGTL